MTKMLNLSQNKLFRIAVFFGLLFCTTQIHSATIFFNTGWLGTPNANAINVISLVDGTGFRFDSANPNDVQFVATGNDIAGTFSYINSSNQIVSMSGIISRQNKSGGTTNGLYFYPYSSSTTAYILVVPLRESQFIAGGSYSSSSDTGNTVTAMNAILASQGATPVMQINSPSVNESATYITFTINFTNNASRSGTSTFPLYLNTLSATIGTDVSSTMQYSSDNTIWNTVGTSVTFPVSISNLYVRIQLINDTLKECTENFTLEAGTITGGGILNTSGTYGTGTINDEENYYVWTGLSSTDWNTATNWVCDQIPVSGGNVVVSPSAVNHCWINGNRSIGYLKFSGANKKVVLDDDTLLATSIVNANSNNHVQSNSTGMLKLSVSNLSSRLFPVGNSTYNPVTITNKSGVNDFFLVRVIDEVFQNGYNNLTINPSRVKRTWDIDKILSNGGAGVDFVFNWNSDEVTAGLSFPSLHHYNGMIWEYPIIGTGLIAANSFIYTGYIGSFSPFSIYNDNGVNLTAEFGPLTAECEDNSIKLQWITYSEVNTKIFLPQLSRDGIEWIDFTGVEASGSSNSMLSYETLLENKGNLYKYVRIQSIDNDGTTDVVGPISINCGSLDTSEITIYPNPSEGLIEISLVTKSSSNFIISVLDGNAREVYKKIVDLEKGSHLIPLDLRELSKGNYQLKICGEDEVIVRSLTLF